MLQIKIKWTADDLPMPTTCQTLSADLSQGACTAATHCMCEPLCCKQSSNDIQSCSKSCKLGLPTDTFETGTQQVFSTSHHKGARGSCIAIQVCQKSGSREQLSMLIALSAAAAKQLSQHAPGKRCFVGSQAIILLYEMRLHLQSLPQN